MAEQPENDSKTEEATPKRRADAARDGDVLQSRELSVLLALGSGAGWLLLFGAGFVWACRQILETGLAVDRDSLASFDPVGRVVALIHFAAVPLGALFAISCLAAIASPMLLGSLGFRSKAMAWKASRLNPLNGLKRIFGRHAAMELLKAIGKAGLIGGAAAVFLIGNAQSALLLGRTDLERASALAGNLLITLMALTVGVLVLIAGADVPAQFFERQRRLRMTREQVKEELKTSEGSPETKQAQRRHQQAILSQSMRKGIAEANVVLTNPTHFAIALRYRPGLDAAPVVVARGRDELAAAIRAEAAEQRLPMLSYPQLTRAIYFTTRHGQPVPADLFQAVATILVYVFNIDDALARGAPLPAVTLPPSWDFDEGGRRRR